jgi:hypothetical protein
MRIKTVWGVFPAFIVDRPLGHSLDGETIGPVVFMAPTSTVVYNTTLAHELVHVKQNYVMFAFIVLCAALAYFVSPVFLLGSLALGVWRLTAKATFILECAAYGESVRQMRDNGTAPPAALLSTARILADTPFYKQNATFGQILKQITKRYIDNRIF